MLNLGTIQRAIYRLQVPVIRINGHIDRRITSDIDVSLQKIKPALAKALAVVINSPGGSLVQSEIIVQKIKNFTEEHHLPLYTFAEEIATQSAYFILASGDHVYADASSQIGSIGVDPKFLGLKNNAPDAKGDQNKLYFSNQRELWFNRMEYLEDLTESEQQILRDAHEKVNKKYADNILKTVGVASSVDVTRIYQGTEAQKVGLVEKIGQYNEVLSAEYPNADVEIVKNKSARQLFHIYLRSSLEIIKRVNQRQNVPKNKYEETVRN